MRRSTMLVLSALLSLGILSGSGAGTAYAAQASACEEPTASVEARDVCLRREAAEEAPEEAPGDASESSEEPSEGEVLRLAPSLDGIALPADSEQVTYNYKGQAVYIARTSDGLLLLPVLQDDGSVSWQVYTESTDTAIPYLRFANNVVNYVILSPEADVEIPEEFSPILLSMGENTPLLPGYENRLLGDEHIYFFYGQDSLGNKGFFRFDGDASQMVRYVEDITIPEPTEPTTTQAPTDDPKLVGEIEDLRARSVEASLDYENLNQDHEHKMLYGTIIIIGLGALCLILLLVIAIVAAKLKSARTEAEEAIQEAEHRSRAQSMRSRRHDDSSSEANANGEGTSEIRRSVRRDSELGKTSSTSEVKPASRQRIERRDSNEGFQAGRDEEKRAVRRRSSSDSGEDSEYMSETVRRPVRRKQDSQQVRREASVSRRAEDSEDQPVRRKAAAEQPERRRAAEDGSDGRRAEESGDEGPKRVRRKRSEEAREDAEWARGENVSADPGKEADIPEEEKSNVTESVRVATRRAKAEADELFEEAADAAPEEDFDVTDFQDI